MELGNNYMERGEDVWDHILFRPNQRGGKRPKHPIKIESNDPIPYKRRTLHSNIGLLTLQNLNSMPQAPILHIPQGNVSLSAVEFNVMEQDNLSISSLKSLESFNPQTNEENQIIMSKENTNLQNIDINPKEFALIQEIQNLEKEKQFFHQKMNKYLGNLQEEATNNTKLQSGINGILEQNNSIFDRIKIMSEKALLLHKNVTECVSKELGNSEVDEDRKNVVIMANSLGIAAPIPTRINNTLFKSQAN